MKTGDYIFKKFGELDEAEQVVFADKMLATVNKEKLKQRKLDIGKYIGINDLKDEAQQIIDNWGMQLGLLTSYDKLNEFTGGFRRKGVYIIGGDSSSGKSTFVLNLATHFDQSDRKVHIVSYEDANTFVAARVGMIMEGLDDVRITLPESQLVEGIYSMDQNRLYEHLKTIKEKRGGLDVVFIDYIQFIALFAEENEYVAINNTMKLFRDLAKTLDIVIVAVSQLNRTKDKEISRFHGSSAIEKLADVAILINRDKDLPDELFAQVVKSKFTWLRRERIRYIYTIKGAKLTEKGTERL